MGFDIAETVKASEDKIIAKVSIPQPTSFTRRFTIAELKTMKQYHLDKADEAQALIDKAVELGVKE